MIYRPPTHGMSTSYKWYIDLPSPWYIDPLPMVYRLPTNGISTPYPWYIDPLPMVYRLPTNGISPTHGILIPYPCYIDPPYEWHLDHPTECISTPLPMVF